MPTERLEKIGREVEERGALPTLPEVPMRVLRLIADEKSSMEQISRTVERDPSLAANGLTVFRSPYYGVHQKVASLKLALAILAVNEVINIVSRIFIIPYSLHAEGRANSIKSESGGATSGNRALTKRESGISLGSAMHTSKRRTL